MLAEDAISSNQDLGGVTRDIADLNAFLHRLVLRVKVEDPNDLTMARSSVYSAFNFFSRLQAYANDKGSTPYEALCEFRL